MLRLQNLKQDFLFYPAARCQVVRSTAGAYEYISRSGHCYKISGGLIMKTSLQIKTANAKHDTSHCWCHSVDRACLLCGENKQKMYLWFGFTTENIVALMFSAAPSCSLPGFGLTRPTVRRDLGIFKWQTREHKACCCFIVLNQPLSFSPCVFWLSNPSFSPPWFSSLFSAYQSVLLSSVSLGGSFAAG